MATFAAIGIVAASGGAVARTQDVPSAALLPQVDLAVEQGPPQLTLLPSGQLAMPGTSVSLALVWPLPSGVASRSVALAEAAGRNDAGAPGAAEPLLAQREQAPANERFAYSRAYALASDGNAPALAPPRGSAPEQEPTISEVQDAALAFAHLDPDRLDSLARRARLAALLPQLGVSVDHTVRLSDTLVASQLTGDRLDLLAGQGYTYSAHATWHLDRLVYDPAEVRVTTGSVRMAHERAALLEQVTTLYFERRRLEREARTGAPDEDRDAQIEELGAEIDALCGGCMRIRDRRF